MRTGWAQRPRGVRDVARGQRDMAGDQCAYLWRIVYHSLFLAEHRWGSLLITSRTSAWNCLPTNFETCTCNCFFYVTSEGFFYSLLHLTSSTWITGIYPHFYCKKHTANVVLPLNVVILPKLIAYYQTQVNRLIGNWRQELKFIIVFFLLKATIRTCCLSLVSLV